MSCSDDILVSVLVPVYGVEPFIEACARSLFGQERAREAEFVFVDDASPDASVARLEALRVLFPELRVRVLHHDRNRGLAAARRTALAAARGEWVLHVDSDDMLLPGALARLLEEAERRPDADLVYGGYAWSPAPGTEAAHPVPMPRWDRGRILREMVAQTYRVDNRTWGVLIRRRLYAGAEPVEGIDFAEDYAVMPRLLLAARAVGVVPQPLYLYRAARDGSYMKRLDARAARQYVAAQSVVSAALRGSAEWERLRDAAMLGRLNIEKWIRKRGLRVDEYDAQLFADGYRPRRWLHRLYAALLRRGALPWVRLAGLAANRWAL